MAIAIDLESLEHDAGPAVAAKDLNNAALLDLIHVRVRLVICRRIAWLSHLMRAQAGSERTDVNAAWLLSLNDEDSPEAFAQWCRSADLPRGTIEELGQVEDALANEPGVRLTTLANLFRLTQPETDLLQLCVAFVIDPGLSGALARLHPHAMHGCANEALAARLFGYGRRSLLLPGSPLTAWALVSTAEAPAAEVQPLTVDPQVLAWLQGELGTDRELLGTMRQVQPKEPLADWPVDATVRTIRQILDGQTPVRVAVVGPQGSGRRTFASVVGERLGLPVLSVDSGVIDDSRWHDAYLRAQRLALLANAALVWHGNGLHRPWPGSVPPVPVQFVTCSEEDTLPPAGPVVEERVRLHKPTIDERRKLLAATIPASAAWPEDQLSVLCSRLQLTVGDITAIGQRGPSSAQEAVAAAREITRQRLGDLARLLDCPFTWADLVLPRPLLDALEDFAFEARERTVFWESSSAKRLFPRGTGLVALLTGPPGTGKTMAAQVIAADLELDLFRIDLATVINKYIGETAKNLARIFARAAQMNGILLFDEADALFSKRTEVKDSHDRYANADTNYLLELLEDFPGIAILGTNKKSNIDPAFIRRVRYVFDFPRPDAAARQRIWTQVIGELTSSATVERLDKMIEALARDIDVSGAQIKNALLGALFVARRQGEALDLAHLLRGIERELAKEGRALGPRERDRLVRHG